MASNVFVDIETVDTFSKNIKNKASNMNNILDELISATMEMENFFETPTAKKMKESLITYLNNSKITCEELDEIGNNVDLSKRRYELAINSMVESTRG